MLVLSHVVQNWKKRWFVLYRNELKYFNNLGDKEPLKIINLEDVMRVDRDDSTGKPNCLRYVSYAYDPMIPRYMSTWLTLPYLHSLQGCIFSSSCAV